MVWKKVVNSDAGDADHFGGNDLDKVSDLFSGVAVDTLDINSLTTFRDQKFAARNPAGTKTLTFANPPIVKDMTRTQPILISPYKFTIGKIGTGSDLTYYAMRDDGSILASDNTSKPELVIQAAIDQCEAEDGGDIYIIGYGSLTSADQYVLSGTWGGFTIGNATGGTTPDVEEVNVICAPSTSFKVPNAFTGTFCRFTNATNRCGWYGGTMGQSTPNNGWIGFEFLSTSQAGCSQHTLQNARVNNSNIGIRFEVNDPDAYVQGCYFENNLLWSPNVGIDFVQNTAYVSGQNSFLRNTFHHNVMLMNNRTVAQGAITGVRDIIGRGNMFIECKVWDLPDEVGHRSSNLTADAEHTIIWGGIMTLIHFQDLSTSSIISDMWYPLGVGKGIKFKDVPKTGNYTASLLLDKYIRVDGTSSAFTITLPTAVGYAGSELTIKRTDIVASSNLITIATTSSQTIAGAANAFLASGDCLVVESDGANWQIAAETPGEGYYLKGSTANRRIVVGAAPGLHPQTTTSTTAPAIDTLWAYPFAVQRTTKFDTITFRVTTNATAGGVARAGIYRDTGNGYPGALIFDTGSIDTTSGGGAAPVTKDTTITSGLQVFPKGLYWIAWECGVAAPQMRVLNGSVPYYGVVGNDSGLTNNAWGVAYTLTHTFGSLPNPYTAGATIATTGPVASVPYPAIGLRPI